MMGKNPDAWHRLVDRYLGGTITREELDELLRMVDSGDETPVLEGLMKEQWRNCGEGQAGAEIDWDAKYRLLMEEASIIRQTDTTVRQMRRRTWRRWAAAAAVLLLVAGGLWWMAARNATPTPYAQHIETPAGRDILPGSTGAVLTLGNGNRILLDSSGNGLLAHQGDVEIVRDSGGVSYTPTADNAKESLYNTVQTPRGRQFRLLLSDGTAVWLNAASSIRFPAAFTGNERKVEIDGEAYFEVAKRADQPFIVSCRGMDIRVTGTHFNVLAYEDESTIQTTLFEGGVTVSAGGKERALQPGEQSRVTKAGEIKIEHEVNTDAVLAWKNGYFSFDQTDLYAVMRQLSRWYDVEIEYEGRIPDRRFGGEISRNSKASEVLRILEESNVHFRIEDKKIIVMP